ncbi:MAG: ferric reductase-like transmembrane domain-containing protein [Gaiellaceae bacterium]
MSGAALVAAAGGSRALWYATRGTGVVALVLLTAIVVLGIAGTLGWHGRSLPRFVVAGLHRNLTLLALAFLAVHIGTTIVDGFAPIGLKDVIIPFFAVYRPIWLGLGAVAFDLLLALTITSLVRVRLGYRRWRYLHWLAYASWPVALVHGLGTGSDARVGWMQALAVASMLAVGAAVAVRLASAGAWTGTRVALAAVAAVVPLATLVWYRSGPAQHGWAARAGTPASLLGKRAVAAPRLPRVAAPSLPAPPFTATFRGRLTQSQQDANGLVLIDIAGRTSGSGSGVLRVRLQGQPTGGGVSMTASGASFGPRAAPDEYVGRIAELQGAQMVLTLRSASRTIDVALLLRIDAASGAVSGSLQASSA